MRRDNYAADNAEAGNPLLHNNNDKYVNDFEDHFHNHNENGHCDNAVHGHSHSEHSLQEKIPSFVPPQNLPSTDNVFKINYSSSETKIPDDQPADGLNDFSASVENSHEVKPKISLWSQLLGGDEESEEEEPEETEEVDELSGIVLLGKHLAKVKLEAEERDYTYRNIITQLEKEKYDQQVTLREYSDRCLSLEEQVKKLEVQNTRKWQIESRDHWIHQIESLKQERNKLRSENEKMSESLKKLQQMPQGDNQDENLRSLLARALSDLTEARLERDNLQKDLFDWKKKYEESEAVNIALKRKLDFELELKWERSRQSIREEEDISSDSFLEKVVDIVAPRN